jgi:hypothetical protein
MKRCAHRSAEVTMTRSNRILPATLSMLAILVVLGATPMTARAQDQRAVGPTPPRLAFIDGEVSFWRPGAEDWTPAQVNTPLAAGDSLYAADGGNLEVQIASRAFVRAGSGTELGIESLEDGYLQLKVTSGHVALDLKRLPTGQRIEVDTPNGAFTIDRTGYYRVDVDGGTSFSTRRGGEATVIPAGGDTSVVPDGQQVVLQGTETATVTANVAPEPDAWDRWSDERDGGLAERPRSTEYVPPDVAGTDDLDRHGEWREAPRYGHVWVPHDVPPDWAPYSTGRWVWDPYYGWSWVDDAPWGWAPYHYGRWVYDAGYWGWAPGPVVPAPIYAPALVAFLGPAGVAVNVGIGVPFVGWVALGFGEPVLPWWGPVGLIGRPYWCGWHGPHVVNNVVINNTRIVNVTNINHFQNMQVHNAVIGVRRDQFGRGRVEHVRLGPDEMRHLQPIRGRVGVNPVSASLAPNPGHAKRPPEAIQHRPIVATHPPQDPTRRLSAAGLHPAPVAGAPEARIVHPRPAGPGETAARRGGFVTTPPPPPGGHRGTGPPAGLHAPGYEERAQIGREEHGRGGAPLPPMYGTEPAPRHAPAAAGAPGSGHAGPIDHGPPIPPSRAHGGAPRAVPLPPPRGKGEMSHRGGEPMPPRAERSVEPRQPSVHRPPAPPAPRGPEPRPSMGAAHGTPSAETHRPPQQHRHPPPQPEAFSPRGSGPRAFSARTFSTARRPPSASRSFPMDRPMVARRPTLPPRVRPSVARSSGSHHRSS